MTDSIDAKNADFQNRDEESIAVSKSKQGGFTLTEVIVVVYIVAVLAAIVINTSLDSIEKARLARCMVEDSTTDGPGGETQVFNQRT